MEQLYILLVVLTFILPVIFLIMRFRANVRYVQCLCTDERLSCLEADNL